MDQHSEVIQQDGEPDDQDTPSNRSAGRVVTAGPRRVLTVVVGAIALLAIAAGVLAAVRDVTEYDLATPEGTVQAYVSAVIDGDHLTADGLLDDTVSCDLQDLDQYWVPDDTRVVLRGTRIDGDRADVRVGIARSTSGELFLASEQFERHTFRLEGGPGQWRITGQPWPLEWCDEPGVS